MINGPLGEDLAKREMFTTWVSPATRQQFPSAYDGCKHIAGKTTCDTFRIKMSKVRVFEALTSEKPPSRPSSAAGGSETNNNGDSTEAKAKLMESRLRGTASAPATRPHSSEGFSRRQRPGEMGRQFPASAPGSRP